MCSQPLSFVVMLSAFPPIFWKIVLKNGPIRREKSMTKAKKMEDCYHCIAWTCCDSLDSYGRGKILEVSTELYSRRHLSDDKI